MTSGKLPPRKYAWPDDAETIRELSDGQLRKLWRYAPRATTKHESHCSNALCDEMVDRGIEPTHP